MPTLEEVKYQLKSLDFFDSFINRSEIKELPKILWEDEIIIDVVTGIYNHKSGILVATNKRLIFIEKGILWGSTVEDFGYNKISSFVYHTGIIFAELEIYASGNSSMIENVVNDDAKRFAKNVRAMITGAVENEAEKFANRKIQDRLNTIYEEEYYEEDYDEELIQQQQRLLEQQLIQQGILQQPLQQQSDEDEFLNKLERLQRLKEAGALTEEEFSKAKMKLLDI